MGRVVEGRARPRRSGVGAGLGFGEPERAEHLARDHRDEILLLLIFRTAVEEGSRAEADAGLERDRHRRVDPGDLLDREAVREVVGSPAAVLVREREPEQPELPHLVNSVDGERVVAVPGMRERSDLGLGEVTNDGSELLLLGRRIELHGHEGSRGGTVRPVDARQGYAVVPDGNRWIIGERPAARDHGPRRGDVRRARRDRARRDSGWGSSRTTRVVRSSTSTPGSTTISVSPTSRSSASTTRASSTRCRVLRFRAPSSVSGTRASRRTSTRTASAASTSCSRPGECYQVNLTRRLTFEVAPDPFALFTTLVGANPAPYGAVCTFGDALPGVAVVSASPELFLRVDGRDVETRPIKGTAADAAALHASEKDRAENVMIVDLARNDLGRVCEFGSVDVPSLFAVEHAPRAAPPREHRPRAAASPTSVSAVSSRATFPPASVTGAPKPRVLQAIEDLEPVRRGVYCGAFGWIDADRARAELAVAIRTFTIAGGRTYLGVGGGIVADSCAHDEWAETELKGARLLPRRGSRDAGEPVDVR